MKLGLLERIIVNNSARASIQRHLEGPMLRKMADQDRYSVCLEIGCGRGIGAQVIVEQFDAEKVIATDIDPEQIKRARRILKSGFEDKIEFKVDDAMALDEPDGKFDAVFSFGVIHHMEDWKKAVKEVSRVLKSGGAFFFEEPLRVLTGSILTKIFAPHLRGGEFDYAEFKNELKLYRMEIVRVKRPGNLAIFGMGRKL